MVGILDNTVNIIRKTVQDKINCNLCDITNMFKTLHAAAPEGGANEEIVKKLVQESAESILKTRNAFVKFLNQVRYKAIELQGDEGDEGDKKSNYDKISECIMEIEHIQIIQALYENGTTRKYVMQNIKGDNGGNTLKIGNATTVPSADSIAYKLFIPDTLSGPLQEELEKLFDADTVSLSDNNGRIAELEGAIEELKAEEIQNVKRNVSRAFAEIEAAAKDGSSQAEGKAAAAAETDSELGAGGAEGDDGDGGATV